MLNKKNIKILLQLLGIAIFVYILLQIDYQLLMSEIVLLRWPFLIVAVFMVVLEILAKSLRWRCILSALSIKISRRLAINLEWLGLFLGVVTPGRVGELTKVYFLEKMNQSVFRSFFSIILDRLIDIAVLLSLGLLIFFFFLPAIGGYLLIFGLVLAACVVFVYLLIDEKSILHRFFGKLIKKILPVDFQDYNRFTPAKFWRGLKGLKKEEVIVFCFYLIAGWLLYFFGRYLIALSLSLNLSFLDIVVVTILIAIVSALPISIAGLGTREAVVIYFFGLFGLSKEVALIFSLLVFSIDLMVISIGLIPYLKESSFIGQVKNKLQSK